jgi:hypothetical protein
MACALLCLLLGKITRFSFALPTSSSLPCEMLRHFRVLLAHTYASPASFLQQSIAFMTPKAASSSFNRTNGSGHSRHCHCSAWCDISDDAELFLFIDSQRSNVTMPYISSGRINIGAFIAEYFYVEAGTFTQSSRSIAAEPNTNLLFTHAGRKQDGQIVIPYLELPKFRF